MKIADISHYQDHVDWERARDELDFVIFRASIGLKPDSLYLQHSEGYGKAFGVYHYVKAGTAQDARQEARFFVECANKAQARPTIYFADIEHETQTKVTTEAVCVAFLDELRILGCQHVGLYIGQSRYAWAGAAIAMCDAIWYPRYGKNTGEIPPEQYYPQKPCALWQYTSKGQVAGIDEGVDLNLIWGSKPLEWFTGASKETNKSKGSGSMFTNLMLAAYCELVYLAHWVYWYGTCGYKCTESLHKSKTKQYPAHYTASREFGYLADIKAGRMCADCVGLIKSFFWKDGSIDGKNVYQSNNCPDKSANGLFEMCRETGPISTIPDIPGLVVWKDGHIGVYVGGGYTVEMRGFAYDCVKRKVTDGPWTKWGKLPMLQYVEEGSASMATEELGARTLRKGSVGNDVKSLQEALMKLGFSFPKYGADGDFGSETEGNVKAFQRDHDLEVTGIFDTAAFKVLEEALNPKPENSVIPEPEIENTDTPDGGSAPAYVLIIEGDVDKLRLIQSAYGGMLALVDSVKVV